MGRENLRTTDEAVTLERLARTLGEISGVVKSMEQLAFFNPVFTGTIGDGGIEKRNQEKFENELLKAMDAIKTAMKVVLDS